MNKIKMGLLVLSAAIMIACFFAFKSQSAEVVTIADENGVLQQAPGGNYYTYQWNLGTIANANNDTLYLPSSLRPVQSDFIQVYGITRTSVSGTANVAVKVECTAEPYSGTTPPTTGWVTALNSANSSAATAATTATTEQIVLGMSPSINYRVIVDGTGTQSTTYRIRVVMKRKT